MISVSSNKWTYGQILNTACLYHFISYLHIITLMLTKWFYFSNFLDKCNAFHRYLTKFSYIVLLFSSPPQWPTTLKDFLSQISYFNSWERASISLFNVQCWTREILVPFLKRLWYDAVLDWGLKSGPPALEASTLPLGYRGGSCIAHETELWIHPGFVMCLLTAEPTTTESQITNNTLSRTNIDLP